ncbi:acyl-CoA dehydrogenase family protein [Actinomycetes bacterium NPDC127524]
MSFFQTEEQKEYIKKLEQAIVSFSEREQELDESRSFPYQNIRELKNFGYTALTLPKEYGGRGGTLYDFLLGQELIASKSGSTALSIGWHLGGIMEINERKNWNSEVKEELMKNVAKGALVNRAATEPKTGSPTRGGRPETTAILEGGSYVITGRKTFTSLSPMLDYFIVSAWVPKDESIGWFLIHRDTAGVSIEETWDVISMQGTGSHDLVMDSVKVDTKYYVENQTKRSAKGAPWLLHIPACYIGIAAAARDYSVSFAKNYTPNSLPGPIADLPNVQRLIGEMDLELLQARHFLYSVAEKWEQQPKEQEKLTVDLAAVKTSITNSAIKIVDMAMRIAGAQSLQRKNPLQRFYRDVRAGLHNPPMDDAVISLLAKTALSEE